VESNVAYGWKLPLTLALSELSSHRMRSFLSTFAVFLGVAALLVMTSFSRGMESQNRQTFLQMGGAQVVPLQTVQPKDQADMARFAKSPGLRLSDFKALQERIPAVEMILPAATSNLRFRAGGKRIRGFGTAQGWDNFPIYNYQIEASDEFNRQNWEKGAAVALIGSRVADDLRKSLKADPIGQELSLQAGGGRVKVIGLIKTESKFDRRSMEISVPLAWLMRQQGTENPVVTGSVKVRTLEEVPETIQAIKAQMRVLHRGVEDVDVSTNEDLMKDSENSIKVMALVTGVISAIALVSGAIGILNILLSSLASRIRELGIQKALGAPSRLLFRQVFLESLLVSGVGGALGCITGILPGLIAKGALPFQPELAVSDLLMGIGLSLGIGVGAGLLPAFKASRLDPVEAMRS
jgi:putative ABC transport system permease protein